MTEDKEFITWLSNLKSQTGWTSLVTYYIPACYPLALISKNKYADVKEVNNELENLIQTDYDNMTIGRIECKEYISKTNIKKLYVCKSQISTDKSISTMLDVAKSEIKGLVVIFSESSTLKTYGGWVGIKKY